METQPQQPDYSAPLTGPPLAGPVDSDTPQYDPTIGASRGVSDATSY